MNIQIFDTAILGAGASGLFAAGLLGARSKVIIEGNKKPGLKILASGGGACNFGNQKISGQNYFGGNPRFCLSALAGFSTADFKEILNKNHVPYTTRHDGKIFAQKSSDILDMLLHRADGASTVFAYDNIVASAIKNKDIFEISTNKKTFYAKNLICALGGLTYPALGASGAAYDIARGFGLNITERYPALTGIIFDDAAAQDFAPLAGISCRAKVSCGKNIFTDDILFTHEGLSGPAIFQISLYGIKGRQVSINFLPDIDVAQLLAANKTSPKKISALLHNKLPSRLLQTLLGGNDKQLANLNKKEMQEITEDLNNFTFTVKEINGYDKAEITAGGVDTKEISSKTMQARNVPGLYFIGEALDISGQLGGYNLHWAWASAVACARALNAPPQNKVE